MEKVTHAIQDEYADEFAWCYGCGRLNETGLHIRTGWDEERTVTIFQPRDEHKAIPGFIYGGTIASLIDCHGTGSAALALQRNLGQDHGDTIQPPRILTSIF